MKIIKWKCILTCHLLLNPFSIHLTLLLPKMVPKESQVKKNKSLFNICFTFIIYILSVIHY